MDTLGVEQLSAIEIALKGHNLVITGSAGTGKSHAVKVLTEELRRRGKVTALTCSTGISCMVYGSALKSVFRQSDPILVRAIREVSEGQVTKETVQLVNSTKSNIRPDGATINLFSKNDLVDDFNRDEILLHPGHLFEFNSTDGGEKNELKKLICPSRLWLKIGIPVILIRNLTDKLVNGLRGTVADVNDEGPLINFASVGVSILIKKCIFEVYSSSAGKVIATREQFPLKPAFGLTIHKAQGMTLDRVIIDCRDVFQPGQLGVALSRVRSINGLCVKNFKEKYCLRHPANVTEFYQSSSTNPLDDCSCCRNVKRVLNETSNIKCAMSNAHARENNPELDEEDFDEEFDQVMKDLNLETVDTEEINIPDDFVIETVLEKIMSYEPDSQSSTCDILTSIPAPNLENFCRTEFIVLTKLINGLNITDPRAVESKELTKFYTKVNEYLCSLEYKLNAFSMFSYQEEPINDNHMHICFNVHQEVRKYLLKQKVNLYQHDSHLGSTRFVTDASKARIRYVGGYCVAKLSYNYSKRKSTHRFNTSSLSKNIYKECKDALAILDLMKMNEQELNETTDDRESLRDMNRRQNLTRGLTSIPDDLFYFFLKLTEACQQQLNLENLHKNGDKIFQTFTTDLCKNENLKTQFNNSICFKIQPETPINILTEKSLEQLLYKIYTEVTKKFAMVLFSQFKKDLKSSYHVEKTMAHRKQIQTKGKNIKPKTEEPIPQSHSIIQASTSGTPSQSRKQAKPRKQRTKSKPNPKERPTETYVIEAGEVVVNCPVCLQPEDGTQNMIGCDLCDDWFHWTCIGIESEPTEDQWFCGDCKCFTETKKPKIKD